MSGPRDDDERGNAAPRPGDEVPAGTPGSAENICRHCGGSGHMVDGSTCEVCSGTGLVLEELGGG